MKKKNGITKIKYIRIGGYKYRIIWADPSKCKEMKEPFGPEETIFGCISYDKNTIWISNKLTKEQEAYVILHELAHGCAETLGKKLPESFIKAFTHLLYPILKELNFKAI